MAPISYWKRKGKIELKKNSYCLTEFQLPEFYFTSKLYNVQASVPSRLFHHVNHAIVFYCFLQGGWLHIKYANFGELLNNSPLFPVSHYATNLYNLFLVISCGCTVLILVTLSCSKNIHFFVQKNNKDTENGCASIIIVVAFPPGKSSKSPIQPDLHVRHLLVSTPSINAYLSQTQKFSQ